MAPDRPDHRPADPRPAPPPPFATGPAPAALFARRARRFETLAARDPDLAHFLGALSRLCAAQNAILSDLRPVEPLGDRVLALATASGLPPLGNLAPDPDDALVRTFDALLAALPRGDLPESVRLAYDALAAAPDDRRALLAAALAGAVEEHRIAEHLAASAALQVHMARLAATLDAARLVRITDATCPACGGWAGVVIDVGRGEAAERFGACPVCASEWRVPRDRCFVCDGGSDLAVRRRDLRGGPVEARACRACGSWMKCLDRTRDPNVDPIADDVATVTLDMRMREAGYRRTGANPFLVGF